MFSPAQPPLTPPRRRKYQRTGNGIPPTQRQWRKGDHGSLKRKPPKIEGYPKVPHPRDTIAVQIQRPVVPHLPKISTGLPFLFRSPEPLFLLLTKEKVVLAPAGQAKTNCKVKTPRSPAKEKVVLPAGGYVPSVRRHSTHRVRAVSKRHSRQETACRQRLGCGPSWASGKTIPRRAGRNQTEKESLFAKEKADL